ncbi:MAG: hypothetical protein JRI25_00020 [Deltaproteobacteria bacterium]|nr:hypothetical protein [Deltaproteobacteria bacterium]MBW2252962.1 hypothetical protein [Deltaproteobacteria bacterium]
MTRRTVLKALVATVAAVVGGVVLVSDAVAARLVFEETVIEGEVRKPEVAVYITRQNLNDRYELELKESFLLKIIESVEHSPF